MNLLDLPQAKHFCSPPLAVTTAITSASLSAFHGALGKGVTRLQEGSLPFQVHQVSLLDSIDRWLVFSVSHYRRAVDMLVPSAAPWAHVTLYYSSFFAANAILGMFGGWIGETDSGRRLVDVELGNPGTQQLKVHRKPKSPHDVAGSHRAFWDFFYDGSASIGAWAPAKLKEALDPANADFGWQIAERNRVNYDMFHAWDAASQFYGAFRPSRGLKSLSGPLQLQLEVAERMVRLALYFAKALAVTTQSLTGCGVAGATPQIRRRLLSQAAPSLLTQSGFYDLIEL